MENDVMEANKVENEVNYKVKDLGLAEMGQKKIEWAESRMPVMMALKKKYSESKPLKGMRIAGCLHVTKETAVLIKTLIAAGADISWSGCNPLSTQDDIAAALAKEGISIYAWHGMNVDEFYWAIEKTLEFKPTLTLDDGADLIFTIHNKHPELAKEVIGGTEETTTGVHRLRAMGDDGKLLYPVLAVNDAETKWDFDNVYGTGQSSLDGILRATSVLIAGKNFVVSGYGHCGRGVAMRAKGLGANVIVTEVNPIMALKATLEGLRVMKMDEAAKIGDIFIIVCNTGHYDCEVNLKDLEEISESKREIRPSNEEYTLKNGKKIFVLAQGRLVNLAAAEGHPSEVMDMSFANQFFSMMWLAKNGGSLDNNVYDVTKEQDQEVAKLKLSTQGIIIDELSEEQEKYSTDYSAGT
jgi:adenosylhomocysteinase